MSACEKYEVWIQLSLDDMLSSEEQAQLERHLAQCVRCRACYEQFHVMKSLLGSLDEPDEPVPPRLHQRILTYVEQNTSGKTGSWSKKKVRRFSRWVEAAAGIAACVLIAFGAARFLPGQQRGDNGAPMLLRASQNPEISAYDSDTKGEAIIENQYNLDVPQAAPGANSFSGYGGAGFSETTEDTVQDYNRQPESMAVDLPPQGGSAGAEKWEKNQCSVVRKVLAVTGSWENLPDGVERESMFSQVIDREVRDCLELSFWKEESWVQELTDIGYSVESILLDGIVINEESDRLLLVFFWE